MKTKPKTLQIPMDTSLSAKWDAFCSCGKNVYSNNAGILDNLLDTHEVHKKDSRRVRFASAFLSAVRSQDSDVQIPQSMLHYFKVEDGHVWENVIDREATKEFGSSVYKWIKLEE